MSTKLLNHRQARWSEFLSRFDFRITYRAGKLGGKPDALTRRSGDLPTEGGDERLRHQQQVLLKPQNLSALELPTPETSDQTSNAPNSSSPALDSDLLKLFKQAYDSDTTLRQILKDLRYGERQSRLISLADCSLADSFPTLRYRGKIYVPDSDALKLYLLKQHHEAPVAGHPGKAKTLDLLNRSYWWPGMRKESDRYVRNCFTCIRSKADRHSPYGLLQPLPIPTLPWSCISMDFVTGLPIMAGSGNDSVLNVVDRLTKQRHFIACKSNIDAPELAKLFIDHVFRLHGLPISIVSDRGPQFASQFWEQLCRTLGMHRNLSTAFHPQSDGQTEVFNAVIEQYLRAFVNYHQDNWEELLPVAEFASNNQESESTRTSPFFASYGFHPRFHFSPSDTDSASTSEPSDLVSPLNPTALSDRLRTIHKQCQSELAYAQARMSEYYDRKHTPLRLCELAIWYSSALSTSERIDNVGNLTGRK